MSTQSKTKSTYKPELTTISRAEYQVLHQAAKIVKSFNNKQLPVSTSKFKTALFRALHDHIMHEKHSTLDKEDIQNLWFLWERLDDVEDFNELYLTEDE